MGFFSKLKGAMNAVTGGGAKVTLEYAPPIAKHGEQVAVRITATSTGSEVKSKGVFVDIEACEDVMLSKKRVARLASDVHHSEKTYSQAFQIPSEFVLSAGGTQTFEGTFAMPPNVSPTFTGQNAKHEWKIRGRIDAFGNDPDSGYQPFRVNVVD